MIGTKIFSKEISLKLWNKKTLIDSIGQLPLLLRLQEIIHLEIFISGLFGVQQETSNYIINILAVLIVNMECKE